MPDTYYNSKHKAEGNRTVGGVTFFGIEDILDGAVLGNKVQSLSSAEKSRARDNIGAYQKPSGGIPKSDLNSDVQATLDNCDSAYQKPSGGIPKTDLSQAVQTSLGKADTALQEHQSLAGYRTASDQDVIDEAQNAAIAEKYAKPSGGIPKTDLASSVRTSLGKADTALQASQKGAENGVASLDSSGKVPIGQLPVDSAMSGSSTNPVQNKVVTAALDGKAPVITDTASGAVASFPDGADGLPLENLVVHVEAVQSGSGDPSIENFRPFSGRTGCNILHSGEDTSNPTVIPVSWQTEAGTVYYGSFDIKTGVKTVEGGVNVYDGVNSVGVTAPEGGVVNLGKVTDIGRAGPDYYSFYTTNIRIGNFGSSTARILTPQEMSDGGFLCTNMPLCTMFETGDPTTTAQYAVGARLTAAGNVRIYIYARADTGITTVDAMNQKLAEWYGNNTPFAYCFRLKTPFTVQLSPGQLFSGLYGVNNIWADCGPVAVEYPADTKLYVDKKLAAIVAALS